MGHGDFETVRTVTDKEIAEMPTVDAEPVRNGYWRGLVHYGFYGFKENGSEKYREQVTYHCSNCGRRTVIKEKYCPSCGTRMNLEV